VLTHPYSSGFLDFRGNPGFWLDFIRSLNLLPEIFRVLPNWFNKQTELFTVNPINPFTSFRQLNFLKIKFPGFFEMMLGLHTHFSFDIA
jgi:hypothetical protein